MNNGPDPTSLIDEQLSAWLDDELAREEADLLAARLRRSPELHARVARYSLIGSKLRGGRVSNVAAEVGALRLCDRVRAALDETARPETETETGARSGPSGRWLPYAAAAGLAIVAVGVGIAVMQGPVAPPVAGPVPASAPQPTALAAAAGQVGGQVGGQAGGQGQASLSQQRLTNYLVYHGEYSGMLSAKVTDSHIINRGSYAAVLPAVHRPATR